MKENVESSSNVVDNSISFARTHCKKFDVGVRKNKGQFFTPKKVACFMAELFDFKENEIKILDPGAGTGTLISAVCDRIYSQQTKPCSISVDVYENDENLLPYLKQSLKFAQERLSKKGHKLLINSFHKNFILSDEYKNDLKDSKSYITDRTTYDMIISNPPYYKLSINSQESKKLKEFVHGQPNIYALFMIASMQSLKTNGQFIFIVPRSFCSGLYFKKIREWFINNSQIDFIHCFESRLKTFEDNVTQEIVIIHGKKTVPKINKKVKISISNDKSFKNTSSFFVDERIIFQKKSEERFIRIPHDKTDLKIIQELDEWENDLQNLGMGIATGKVVDFRTEENLVPNVKQNEGVPLLWMHNLKNNNVEWPLHKYSKNQGILLNETTKKILIPTENYILLKRFTAKNQKRRLYATPLLKKQFQNFPYIGLENHLNYIFGLSRRLSIDEVYGLSALFNSSFYDVYYRTFGGNTQVNANEMRKIPLPPMKKIVEIGHFVKNSEFSSNIEKDCRIGQILDFDDTLLKIIKNY